jgi:hypothetical protein
MLHGQYLGFIWKYHGIVESCVQVVDIPQPYMLTDSTLLKKQSLTFLNNLIWFLSPT